MCFFSFDWNDRTTFAHINQSTRYISAAINTENPPPFYCDHRVKCRLNYAINFIKTIVIQDGNNNSPVAISSIIFLSKNSLKLKKITYNLILRRDYIKSISSALIERDTTHDIQLNTTNHNLLSFHKHLDERNENSTRTVNIKLISRTDDSSSSSSSSDEEEASIPQKRHSSEYETPLI